MSTARDIRKRLVGAGGRMSQDLGLGRIPGQILVHIYLSRNEQSLDDLERELGLSKASVSISVRQLERLGMVYRVWKKGDRKSYYRTADNFTKALQKGVAEFINQKMQVVSEEIDETSRILDERDCSADPELKFLEKRVGRAARLKDKVYRIMENPLLKLYTRGR